MLFTFYINYYTQKYTVMVWNYKFLTLKFVLINERDSNKKLPKIFADENLQLTQKKLPQKKLRALI